MSTTTTTTAAEDGPLFRRENGRTLVRGADGTYTPLLSDPAPLPAESLNAASTGGWYIAKRTEPEPRASPAYDDLSEQERVAWFGPDAPPNVAQVWHYLAEWIARTFPGVPLMRSPALTGCLMIEHTLPWAHDTRRPHHYHQLPDELARLVAATTTPLRMQPGITCPQVLTVAARRTLREYRVYDARLAYAKWLRSLPIITEEGVTHDHQDAYEPYRPGRYLVCVSVPKGWAHIGLARRALPSGGYDYPDRPGVTWCTWLEECELRLLHEQGWVYHIQERILYAPKSTRGSDPLRVFCERMFPEVARIDAATPNPARRALRHALRALLITPVGLWHRGSVASSRAIDDPSELQAGEELGESGGHLLAQTFAPLAGPVTRWHRPEWSAAVYGYTHVAALRKALSVPRSALLGIRGDALHLADCSPGWTDDGRIGTYRCKEAHDFSAEPYPAPHTPAEFAQLERAVRHG